MTYLAYGVAIDSDLPLRLPAVDRVADVVVFERPEPIDDDVAWFDDAGQVTDDEDDAWCDAGRVGQDYYLSFSDTAEFTVSPDGSRIGWYSFDDRSPTLSHLLLDHVMPRALARRGHVVLHGSCLSTVEGSCFAIVGDSGQGKSTLAAALAARGNRFLADDCVVVDWTGDHPVAMPAYPELRLDRASVALSGLERLVDAGRVTRNGTKKRMAFPGMEPTVAGPQRLVAVFVLRPSEGHGPGGGAGPALGPALSAVELLSHSFHLNAPEERRQALDPVAVIAADCEVRVVDYRHSPEGLAATLDRIEQLATAASHHR